ncbi:Cytochrome b5 heme-binding domain-containing protein [Fusarium sp. Ph1]|nr:Cytochrome b5 heme-binding domain-containing protein [Fusarium sp. Ph1]
MIQPDVSKFLNEHPGGDDVIMDVAGEDTTEAFDDIDHSEEANEMLAEMFVGGISTKVSLPCTPVTSWVS